MSIMLLQGAVEQGFIYALVALALYLSYRTLDIADLTTDGTFVLGCAVWASRCWALWAVLPRALRRALSPHSCIPGLKFRRFWRASSP